MRIDEDAKEEMEENQVRFDTDGMKSIIIMYENKDESRDKGLVNKKVMLDVIKWEHEILRWNKKSKNFSNKKFNDNTKI